MTTSPTPDDLTVRELVALRLMLEGALRKARTAGRYTRGSAVVSLDASVERATYLVAVRRGLTMPGKATLPDVYSKLVESFGGAWKPPSWAAINKLHIERNKVQHQGLEPDRDQLPVWIQAVEDYVVSLIRTEHVLDIRRVVLADAITDSAFADLLRRADEALAAGDVETSVRSSLKAFDAAVDRWTRMHKNPYRPTVRTWAGDGFVGGPDHQDKEIESLRRATAESSFAMSRAEHDWFRSTRKEKVDVLDADDAERILTFAFSWIASFEVAAREWVPDRLHRAAVAARKQRSRPGPAQVEDIRDLELGRDRQTVVFSLVDVPPEPEFDRWASTLSGLIGGRPRRGTGQWTVNLDGTVTLRIFSQEPPGARHLDVLAEALEQVEQEIERQDLASAERDATAAAEAARREGELDVVRLQLPDWIENIEWATSWRQEEKASWEFSLRRVANLPGRSPAESAGRSLWSEVRTALLDNDLVEQCYGTGDGALRLTPALEVDDLIVVIATANDAASTYLAELEASQEQMATTTAAVHAELAAALTARKLRS